MKDLVDGDIIIGILLRERFLGRYGRPALVIRRIGLVALLLLEHILGMIQLSLGGPRSGNGLERQ